MSFSYSRTNSLSRTSQRKSSFTLTLRLIMFFYHPTTPRPPWYPFTLTPTIISYNYTLTTLHPFIFSSLAEAEWTKNVILSPLFLGLNSSSSQAYPFRSRFQSSSSERHWEVNFTYTLRYPTVFRQRHVCRLKTLHLEKSLKRKREWRLF